ncbi:MAG: hypothetical protein Q4A81_04275 [Pasteurellaceae bacterium]|nr:hypothetical protein [Pasteurellaceae bacterium]
MLKKEKLNGKKLKNNIGDKKDKVFVRAYGRNGNNHRLYNELYEFLFDRCINIDPTNNSEPTKILSSLTSYVKTGRNANIRNYQVSHIFGKTKNPYAFCAPWNVVYIPKIIDPFTGHESQSELKQPIQNLYKGLMIKKYRELILEYNQLMKDLEPKIKEYFDSNDRPDSNWKIFKKSVFEEFSIIPVDIK